MKIKRYYIHQFGYWWSLKPAEWRDLVESIVSSKDTAFNLDNYTSLKHRPRAVDGDNYALLPYRAYCILDWGLSEFEGELQQLNRR